MAARRRSVVGGILAVVLVLIGLRSAQAEPALWMAESATARVYLFGTMHILPQPADWFGGKVAEAFDHSGALWEEANVGLADTAVLRQIAAEAIVPDYDLWRDFTGPDAVTLRQMLVKCGMSPVTVSHFRPWLAGMVPMMCGVNRAGTGAQHPDSWPEPSLLARAKAAGKTIGFLETAAEQIGYLAGASKQSQIAALHKTIREGPDHPKDFADMEKAWVGGDAPALARLVARMAHEEPAEYKTLFVERNARFATRIAGMLGERGVVFVAIGAGHLVGPDSVQAKLLALGIACARQ